MGLASAMSTALTGLTAAETTIDVVGNNLANSSTVGFKASQASFATQFLQTLSLGAQPTGDSGGTNPRQVGLGTMVSDITPDFSQGTVEISSNPLDLAIQGEGFYVVQGRSGEQLYTRNGIFKLNAANEIVTITGNRLLGFGVDDQYQIQRTVLDPITIPLGAASVAQPTQNAYLEGQLTPTGEIADIAQIIQTGILGDSRYEYPTAAPTAEIGAAGALDGSYNYYVTYFNTANGRESRPFESPSITLNVDNQQINLSDLPQPADPSQWDEIRIYRNVANTNEYHRVTSLATGATTYTDNTADNVLATLPLLDFDGPKIAYDTLLTNIRQRDGHRYEQVFEEGTLQFNGRKGGRAQETKSLTIDANTTVSDLITFMEESLGIQRTPGPDPVHPIPIDSASGNDPGGKVTLDGRIVLTGNNGLDNAIEIGLSDMLMVTSTGATNVNLPFGTAQLAVGESAVTDFIVYDSLGIPLRVRVTMVMESRDSSSTTYRWFADSPDNDPASGSQIAVGTGLISFDGEGNLITATESTVSIQRRNVPSASPLEFELDFSQISGLAASSSALAVSRQDGSAPGTLTSFIVGEDGTIRGVFSNGVTRDLAQIRLARFSNPAGLEQRGENMFAEGVNSGLPVHGDPGQQGIGTIVAGAVELSNTDIGSNLIDLILASTMYRGNTRVITTAQQMIDELLALRR